MAWGFRVTLLETALESILDGQGITGLKYEIHDIDFTQLKLANVEFGGGSEDQAFDLSATDLTLEYRLADLGLEMVSAVDIKTLFVNI